MIYNYYESVRNDINDWLEENGEEYASGDGTISEQAEQEINDALWVCDSVTGNASGSYTLNTYKAEENLCHNLELLKDAIFEFGGDFEKAMESAESADVTIRCWLVGQLLHGCIEKYNETHEKTEEETED